MPKGGEGSKGGVVIGHTKSGKAIYKDASHEDHKSFKPDDHKSAANLHQDVYDRAQKKLHEKHQSDENFKPSQKVFDFLQHHQRQAAMHTGGSQKPGQKPGDKKKKVDPEKEEKKKVEDKVDSKAQMSREMHVANINKLRSEGKTGEARRLYDKHVNPEGKGAYIKKAYNLLEALGKGGPGSGRKGHTTNHEDRNKIASDAIKDSPAGNMYPLDTFMTDALDKEGGLDYMLNNEEDFKQKMADEYTRNVRSGQDAFVKEAVTYSLNAVKSKLGSNKIKKGGPGSGKKGHTTGRQMISGTTAQTNYDFNKKFKHAPVNKDIEVSSDSSLWHEGNIPKGSKISNLAGGVHVKFPMGHKKENHGHREYGVKIQSHENNIKNIEEGLNKAKYLKREGSSGNYKYTYDEPQSGGHKQLLKEAFGKQITFSGPGGKEYTADVYGEPDEENKIILKFPSHGYRRVEIASITNPQVSEPGAIVQPKGITKYGSLGWPPSGFKEPERKGNKTTEKLWYKLGTEDIEGRPSTTGKLSAAKNQYMSPVGSKCNLVGNVAFGKASDLAQRQLNQKLQMTEVLLTDMGIKLKTPMDFICQDMENGQRGVMAQFLPMNQHRNDKINLAKNLETVNKSLLHEIGHGIDYAMEQKGMAGSYFRGNPTELKGEIDELTNILKNSKFYEATGAKDAPGNIGDDLLEPDDRYSNYLKDQSEVFARAFEVYTLGHAQVMVDEGKLPQEYIDNFVPDYLKAGFTQKAIEPEAFDETMDAVTKIMDKIFRNRAIQKAMKQVDLLETLRKNVVSTDDQGSATETGMYSNDLYSNASNPLMDLIRDSIEDNDFSGDPVRVMIAPDTVFTCTKDTDGVYSGTVNKNNENVLKIEKQTLPTLLQMLKIKELIPVEVEEPKKEESGDYKLKVLDLLGKLL